jgi:hypothetical protein
MRTGADTLIFWGAGATASIGLRTTQQQANSIKSLAGVDERETLTDRVNCVVSTSIDWVTPLIDLLAILGDDSDDMYQITLAARDAMSRHWHNSSREALDGRINKLRALFDWSALKEVMRACPGFKDGDRFQLQDVFNLIDLHAHSFHGFPVPNQFLPPGRLVAARRALQMLLNTLFYIDWQKAIGEKKVELDKHLGFARLLTEHHQQVGLSLAATRQHFDSREFYLGDIAFASLNYDPLALWAQFIANRDANHNPPYIGVPRVPLKIFHDFGIFMAVSTIATKTGDLNEKERVWYPLNEASAQRLNDRDHESRRVRINKFLFPHGCLCWRECPSCGKLSAFMGKEWDFFTPALISPPPLRGFVKWSLNTLLPETDNEDEAWKRGEVDVRSCVHCGESTFAQHTQVAMQSNFKAAPPSFIDEVQRDLRVATQAANHIILMGYSLPPDDVTYRAFFAARQQRQKKDDETPVKCSVVVGQTWGDCWHGPEDIGRLLLNMEKGEAPRTTLEAARDLFGRDNVRFFGGGIPEVFCDGDTASPIRFHQLIDWNATS